MTTPDGRPGFATLLVEQGWVVYVVDRPGHGRSPFIPELMGEAGPPLPADVFRMIFLPPSDGPAALPFGSAHTQWPGDRNDPADAAWLRFRASDGPFAADAVGRHTMERDRLVAFLQQAGCNAVHIELANEGVRGNSHAAMFEKNNADVIGRHHQMDGSPTDAIERQPPSAA